MPSTISTVIFDPTLSTVEDIRSLLRTKPKGTAHPFDRTLHVWTGKDFETVDLRDKPDTFFLDDTRLNELGGVLGQRMTAHEGALTHVLDYEVVSATDLTFDIPFHPDQVLCFALSLSQRPSFYDAIVINGSADVLCYAATKNTSIRGLKHSGDMVGAGSVLLHTLIPEKNMTSDSIAVGVSGYTNTALHRYKAQNPAVLLVNHDAKVLYLIPVPLDAASIGNATLCLPLVLKREGDVVRATVLTNPPVQEGIYASGSQMAKARGTVRDAIQTAEALNRTLPTAVRPVRTPTKPTPDGSSGNREKASAAASGPVTALGQKGVVVIAEVGTTPPSPASVRFGLGLSTTEIKGDTGPAVFPCCIGNTLEGSKVLALAKPFQGDREAYENAMAAIRVGSTPVVTVTDRMSDQCRVLNPTLRLNGLFIIQPTATYNPSILDSPAGREKYLAELNINAVTALAGPQSFVVVQLGENYFLYRGVSWPGVFPAVPSFGYDMTEEIRALVGDLNVLRDAGFAWPSLIDLRSGGDRVYLGPQTVPVDGIAAVFSAMDLPTVLQLRPHIQDVLTQLQCILNPENVNRVSGELICVLKAKISDAIGQYRDPYVAQVLKCVSGQLTGEDKLAEERKKADLHAAMKGAEREAKEATQWLIDSLGQLVSSRTSSSKNHDLNQIAKKVATANNVADAKNMKAEDVGKIISAECSKIGLVLGNTDAGTLRLALTAVAEDRFLTSIQSPPLSETRLLTASAIRSSAEVSALLPVVKDMHRGPLAGKASSSSFCWALPQLAPESDVYRSSVPWPCFDRHVNLTDPSELYWPEEAALGNVAKLRILARGTFASASTALVKKEITPSSRDLGFFLISALLDLMEDMAGTTGNRRLELFPGGLEGKPDDFDDPAAQAVRGMFGQLFSLMASGAGKPLCMAWQLIMKNPKMEIPDHREIGIYSRVASLLPHTRWPLYALQRNARLFLVRALRQNVVDPVTAPIRKAVAAMAKSKDREHLDRRNRELAFLQIAVEVARNIKGGTIPEHEVRTVASRLLARMPVDGRTDGGMGIVTGYFTELAKHGKVTEGHQKQVAQACADIFMKRSGHFKKAKNVALKALKTGKEGQAVAVVEAMAGEKKKVEAAWDAEDIKIQNWAAYAAVLAADGNGETLTAPVSGDAERVRIPWRVLTGEQAAKAEVLKAVADILGERSVTDSSGVVVVPETVAGTVTSMSLETRLRGLQNGDKAADLHRDMQKWTVESFCTAMGLPKQATRTFLACTGRIDEDSSRDLLIAAAEKLLEGWQDPVAAEGAAVTVIT